MSFPYNLGPAPQVGQTLIFNGQSFAPEDFPFQQVAIVSDTYVGGDGTTNQVDVPELDIHIPAGSSVDLFCKMEFAGTNGITYNISVAPKSGTAEVLAVLVPGGPNQLGAAAILGTTDTKNGNAISTFHVKALAREGEDLTIGISFATINPGDILGLEKSIVFGTKTKA